LSGARSERRRRVVVAPRAPLGGVRARRRSDPGAARVGRLAAPALREATERAAVSRPALREGAATQPDRHAGGLSAPRGAAARRPARAGDRRLRGLAPGIGRASTLYARLWPGQCLAGPPQRREASASAGCAAGGRGTPHLP